MLTKLVGIADIRDIIREHDCGFKEELVYYPMGEPINDFTAHLACCASMIAKDWIEFRNVELDP